MEQKTARVDQQGRIVIPATYRHALGMQEGDAVVLQLDGGILRILTRAEAIRRAQKLVAKYTGGKRSLVDELIAERHTEPSP